jgi:6-phosphofructokinase 1
MVRRIAVLTSGGDAPGMNAAIRAVVRTGIERGLEVWGVRNGYKGLIEGDLRPLGARSVGGILGCGGTILGSARSPDFKTDAGVTEALAALGRHDVEAVVVIGGGGSQTGALTLSRRGVRVVGVASTIDNDLVGSDVTIGVDTALNIAVEAIDRLRVTASSHRRAMLVEVMGRDCGYIGLMAGIAGGAEAICIPEVPCDPEAVADEICEAYDRGKPHALVVVAEGAAYDAAGLTRYFHEHDERLGFEVRTTILGHVQRGGTPTVADRLLGSHLGTAAVDTLARGIHGVLCGMTGGRVVTTPLAEVVGRTKPLPAGMLEVARVLAR